jgi:hypothetical protein
METPNKVVIDGMQFGTGASPDPEDTRDFALAAAAPFAAGPFDWNLGFDIELVLGFRAVCNSQGEFFGIRGREGWGVDRYREIVQICKERNIPRFQMVPNDQGSSSSCTGQGAGKYVSVLNMIETGKWVEISARDIYAYISLGMNQGATLRDAMKLCVNRGAATEDLVSSYRTFPMDYGIVRIPMTEQEYLEKPIETATIEAIRTALRSKEYRTANISRDTRMDEIAWAMLLGFGCYFGVEGANNGTWGSAYPKLPVTQEWGHAIYGGRVGMKDGGKFVGLLNSWGNKVGERGWQYLGIEYIQGLIMKRGVQVEATFNPWTLIDKPNSPTNNDMASNAKIIKDKNSSAVGVWLPFFDEAGIISLCANLGIAVPRKEDKTIDWDAFIQGELTLK